jgi:hypothetical protein
MREVKLYGSKAKGRVALVDDEDYELVMESRWLVYEHKRKIKNGYRIDGPYAVTGVHMLVKWFASRSALGTEANGALLTLTGTIKKLEEFKGVKATVLTRVKVTA